MSASTPAPPRNVFDDIRDVYEIQTDEDFWGGILGMFTNAFGYMFGNLSRDEYYNLAYGFADYTDNYQLVLDDMLQFDRENKTLTISKELQHMMVDYLNQDSYSKGYIKLVSNPALMAKKLVILNQKIINREKTEQNDEGDQSLITTFNNLMHYDGLGFATINYNDSKQIQIKYAKFDDFTSIDNPNVYFEGLLVDEDGVDVPLPNRENYMNVLYSTAYQSFGLKMRMRNVMFPSQMPQGYQFSIVGYNGYGQFVSDKYYDNATIILRNRESLPNRFNDWFVFGSGSKILITDFNKFVPLEKRIGRYRNYNPKQNITYKSDDVFLTNHYNTYNEINNYINNYINENPNLTTDEITIFIDNYLNNYVFKHENGSDDDDDDEEEKSNILDAIVNGFNAVLNKLSDFKDNVADGFNSVLEKLNGVIEAVKNIDSVKNGKEGLIDFFIGLLGDTIGGLIELIFTIIGSVVETLLSLVGKLFGFIGTSSLNLINMLFQNLNITQYESDVQVGQGISNVVTSIVNFIPKPIFSVFIVVFVACVIIVLIKIL